ncbi:MAG: hypothetical protein Kow0029_29480 [Candidatus Rifleibacteriota bacterium]
MYTFSGKKFYLLGIAFVFLAGFAFALNWYLSRTPIKIEDPIGPNAVPIPDINSTKDQSEESILEKLKFKEVHEAYEASYLKIVQRINELDTSNIDIKKYRYFFSDYEKNKKNYRKILKKVEDYQKDFKLKCFAKMRSLILAVLFHDRKMQKKMTRYDPELLKKIGALSDIPKCPSGGVYSIIYKDGRRFFHCSIHGTLRN